MVSKCGSHLYLQKKLIWPILLFVLVSRFHHVIGNEKWTREMLDKVLKNYDKRFRPNYQGDAVEVGVTAYVLSMPEVDTTAMTMTINLYFRQTWKDRRLAFDGNESITLDGIHWDKIWVPDTFFTNEISSIIHETTVPNTFVTISTSGQVLKSSRYTLQIVCPMNLQYFPFDEQICELEIESYGYKMNDISYKWNDGNRSFGISSQVNGAEYRICGNQVYAVQLSFESGNYSRLCAKLWLCRGGGHYIKFFIPCIILAGLSFIALLMADIKMAVFANFISTGMALLFVTLSSGLLEIPRVSVTTSLDTFAAITYTFIILSLLISILNLYLSKRSKRSESIELRNLETSRNRLLADDEINLCPNPRHHPLVTSKYQSVRKTVEDILTRAIPVVKITLVISYGLTNVIFWSVHPTNGQLNPSIIADDWNLP